MDFGGGELTDMIEEAETGSVRIIDQIVFVKLTHSNWEVVMSTGVSSYSRIFNQVSMGTYIEIPNLAIEDTVYIDVAYEAAELRDMSIKSERCFCDGPFKLLYINRTDDNGKGPVSFQYIFSNAEFVEKQVQTKPNDTFVRS